MKNLYMTLAMVCALGVSAVAANTGEVKKMRIANNHYPAQSLIDNVNAKSAKEAKKSKTRAGSLTVDDIIGTYATESDPVFKDQNGNPVPPTAGVSVTIDAVTDTDIILTFQPFCSQYSNMKMDPLYASFDADAATITINVEENQELGYVNYSDIGLQYLSFTAQTANYTTGRWESMEALVGHVNDDGTIQLCTEDERFGFVYDYAGSSTVPAGTYYCDAFSNMKLVAPDYFKYNADEWETVGNAIFTDNFQNWRFKSKELDEYCVEPFGTPLERNKENKNMYLLKNVYQYGNFAELNVVPDAPGYIVFNIEDPECVWMRPLTGCGMWALDEDEEDIEFLPCNQEGQLVFIQEYSIAEAKALLLANEYEVSNLDTTTGTVNLINIIYGFSTDPYGSYWMGEEMPCTLTIQSEVFKSAGEGGVDGIISDSANAPKRFFNLQGVEIANPEAGQVVIVREGNKSSKAIF